MQQPRTKIAVVSFPGNNCEVESVRVIREAGMDALYFRWNDDRAKLNDVDGYFIPGGFSYEDRGRSGMVAGRDPLMDFIGQEAEAGKTVIGNCNGAQILVESGLIPLGSGLRMSLARNVIEKNGHHYAPGFLSEWVWITPTGGRNRCATSDWEGALHMPIAHGEGRFTTADKDLFAELKNNNQIAFSYCDAAGNVSDDVPVTPNGSMYAAAGICNAAGNVVALMPHPERTPNGAPYFASLKRWIEQGRSRTGRAEHAPSSVALTQGKEKMTEVFISALITNNEERTVEQTARRIEPSLTLKQWKYFSVPEQDVQRILGDLTLFNSNKEAAFIRRGSALHEWSAGAKLEKKKDAPLGQGMMLFRKDLPDTAAEQFGTGSETGVAYDVMGVSSQAVTANGRLLEVFCNPHSGTLEILAV